MMKYRPLDLLRRKAVGASPLATKAATAQPSDTTVSSSTTALTISSHSSASSPRPCLRRPPAPELACAANGTSFAFPGDANAPREIQRNASPRGMLLFYARLRNALPAGFYKNRKHNATVVRFNERSNEYYDSQELTEEECSSYWYSEREINDMIRYYCEYVHLLEYLEE